MSPPNPHPHPGPHQCPSTGLSVHAWCFAYPPRVPHHIAIVTVIVIVIPIGSRCSWSCSGCTYGVYSCPSGAAGLTAGTEVCTKGKRIVYQRCIVFAVLSEGDVVGVRPPLPTHYPRSIYVCMYVNHTALDDRTWKNGGDFRGTVARVRYLRGAHSRLLTPNDALAPSISCK